MNLAVVTARLDQYGGSEIYLLECLKRWQRDLRITLYTASFKKRLFSEFEIDPERVDVVLLPQAENRGGRFDLFQEMVVQPRLWEKCLRDHDLYFLYLAPTHMIRRKPSIWFAAEPIRMLYDLRHHHARESDNVEVHVYPKLSYETVQVNDLQVLLELIEEFDNSFEVEGLATNSLATSRYLEALYGRKPDRVAYPGINPWPSITPLPEGARRAISVGRLWASKRVDLILRALSYLPSGELLVVGDGPERLRLEDLTQHLGLNGRVHFTGVVSSAVREGLYAQSTCCIYTPLREPFGMVPLEAAAAGRAVLATEGGGFGEVLNDECALFVPDDPGKIAAGLQALFDSPDRARAMGEAGHEIAAEFTWDRTASTLLDYFREVGGECRRRSSVEPKPEIGLGAHFYPWYRTERATQHWNENRLHASVVDFPQGGPYSSCDPEVIERQLDTAIEAGLDFLTVNWQITFAGLNSTEVEATRRLFEIIDRRSLPLSISLLLAFSTEDPKRFEEVQQGVQEEYFSHPAYHRVSGRPVLWYFLTDAFFGCFFQNRDALSGFDALRIATGGMNYGRSLPRGLRNFFDGWTLYSPLQVSRPSAWSAIWRSGYRELWETRDGLRVFTVCPGFDDTHLESLARRAGEFRSVDRREGETYKEMQDFTLGLSPLPDLVMVTSFNEFHENTHIEPSERHGDAYIQATRAFKERLLAASRGEGRAPRSVIPLGERT